MARYSQVIGPAADFIIPISPLTIPGMTINRFWDDGELLIAYTIQRLNASAVLQTAILTILIDNSPLTPHNPFWDVPAGGAGNIAGTGIFPITSAYHRVSIFIQGSGDPADIIFAQGTTLTVIQLPLWDSPSGIITL